MPRLRLTRRPGQHGAVAPISSQRHPSRLRSSGHSGVPPGGSGAGPGTPSGPQYIGGGSSFQNASGLGSTGGGPPGPASDIGTTVPESIGGAAGSTQVPPWHVRPIRQRSPSAQAQPSEPTLPVHGLDVPPPPLAEHPTSSAPTKTNEAQRTISHPPADAIPTLKLHKSRPLRELRPFDPRGGVLMYGPACEVFPGPQRQIARPPAIQPTVVHSRTSTAVGCEHAPHSSHGCGQRDAFG